MEDVLKVRKPVKVRRGLDTGGGVRRRAAEQGGEDVRGKGLRSLLLL